MNETNRVYQRGMEKDSLGVIIPIYNEFATVREIYQRVAAMPMVGEIVMVDDCSTDGTREVLQQLKQAHDTAFPPSRFRLTVLYHQRNTGKAAAIRAGIRVVTAPMTIIQDADLEYSPSDYPVMIQPILDGTADVVYGSRFVGFPRRVLFFWHAVANRILTSLSNMTTNLNLTDMETGYKAFKTDVLKGIKIESNRFGFEPEVTAKVAKLGLRIYEVPISYHGRRYEEGKKITWKDGLAALWFIFKYWLSEDVENEAEGRYVLEMMHKAGKYHRWLFERFESHVGGRVLEVGAGVGSMSRFLMAHESVTLTDVSDSYLLELARSYGGRRNVRIDKLDLSQPPSLEGRFDTAVCINVLEHIDDDGKAIKYMYDLLEPGGRLILFVPAMRRLYCAMDRRLGHRRRYELPDLRAKLHQAGFEILKSRHYNILAAWGWVFNGKVLGRHRLPSRQFRMFNWILPLLRLEEQFASHFGLSILAVARKPLMV